MQFIKNFFNQDSTVIGLCSLKKQKKESKIYLDEKYKKTHLTNFDYNFILL